MTHTCCPACRLRFSTTAAPPVCPACSEPLHPVSDREQLVGYRLIGSEDRAGSAPHDHPMAMPEALSEAIPVGAIPAGWWDGAE
jgi:hypothetical protein